MTRRMNGRKRNIKKKVMRRSGKSPEIHCMLIPTDLETLLLPTSTIAEVIDFSPPQAMDETPGWLLGQVEWQSRQVPVFSFSALINGKDVGKVSEKSKIMILKSLSKSARVPFLGLLLGDLPRLSTVKQEKLVETGDEKKSLGVYSRVSIDETEAIVPVLDRLTHLVTHATFGALPITQLDH